MLAVTQACTPHQRFERLSLYFRVVWNGECHSIVFRMSQHNVLSIAAHLPAKRFEDLSMLPAAGQRQIGQAHLGCL